MDDSAASGSNLTRPEQNPRQALTERLTTEVQTLLASASVTGHVDPEQLSRAEQLHKLGILAEALEKPRPRKRWPLVAFIFVTTGILTLLLFVRVRSTTVLINASVSEISVHSDREQMLNEPLQVSMLEMSPLQEVWVEGEPIEGASPGAWLRVGRIKDSTTAATVPIVLPPFVLGRDDSAVLQVEPDVFRLSLFVGARAYNISGRGRTEIATNTGYRDTIDFGISPLEVVCCTGAPFVVSFSPSSDTLKSRSFTEMLQVDSLSFNYQHGVADREVSAGRLQSGVVAAEIVYSSLSGKTTVLRRGDNLQFRRANGNVRVEFVRDRMQVSFYGTVRGMSTGDHENPRSLMPTWLEWLQAQRGVWLLWAVAIYLVGLVSGLVEWWRKR